MAGDYLRVRGAGAFRYDPALDARLSRVHACDGCGRPVIVVGLELRDWRYRDLCDDEDRPMHRCANAAESEPIPIPAPVKVEMARTPVTTRALPGYG